MRMEAVGTGGERVLLLELERELTGTGAEEAMRRHDGCLQALGDRLRTALDGGLPPDEYGRVAELGEAVKVARKVLRLTRER